MLKILRQSGLSFLWVSFLVLGMDRYAKYWVMQNLSFAEPLRILPIFNLTLAYNTGAAFSFLHQASGWQNIFLGGLAFVVSVGILFVLAKSSSQKRWMNVAFCFILGGALGNAWDRILYGYVIDFFDFHLGHWHYAIFNTADSAICIGAFMLMIEWLVFDKKQG